MTSPKNGQVNWEVQFEPTDLYPYPVAAPEGVNTQRDYVLLEIEGPFDFNAIGILQSFLAPLAEARIPIFAVSTYNTDFVLVHEEFEQRALEALKRAGYELVAAQIPLTTKVTK